MTRAVVFCPPGKNLLINLLVSLALIKKQVLYEICHKDVTVISVELLLHSDNRCDTIEKNDKKEGLVMNEHLYRWRNRELRAHTSVVEGILAPTLLLTNTLYLNVFLKKWIKANIWIYQDRIVYVGKELPPNKSLTETVDCEGRYVVPGYIEPHVHPFQLYNPWHLAEHAAQTGTTTMMNDNLAWLFLLDRKKAFSIMDDFMKIPVSMYWWARFDSQSSTKNTEEVFNNNEIMAWLHHEAVVQGGELTSWPQVLEDDDQVLYWMQEAKRMRKPVEGHFPGASEQTLTKLKLLGASADHEAMTGKEAVKRLELGYHTSLRYSSIRPDLPVILKEMREEGIRSFDQVTFTTDGSTPSFYEKGLINQCIEIALEAGLPPEEAYAMASYNAARHLNLRDVLGSIAPGQVAHLNILESKDKPNPLSVIAKGKWLKRDGRQVNNMPEIDWDKHGVQPMDFDWELEQKDLQFSVPVGLEMVNDVITRPFFINIDSNAERLDGDSDEAFLMLMDRKGEWRMNTILKGFTKRMGGLASSYSSTGDIILIGKAKSDILLAFKRMKELGGGIVLADQGEIIFELPLALAGMMFEGRMKELIEAETKLREILGEYGYKYEDPVYNLLFLSSTHLPYIRITPNGIIDVMKKEVLFPATLR